MNRKQINQKIDRIISSHRNGHGGIPAMNMSDLRQLPPEWAPHSLSVPVSEVIKGRWREDLTR